MLRQCFPEPSILSFVRPNYDYEVVSSSIVGVKEVRNDSKNTKAAGKNYELVICSQLLEETLLVFLKRVSVVYR
jgi:hypothetical protein